MKKFLAVLLAMAMIFTSTTVWAVRFGDVANVPRDFWPIFTPYEAALNAGDSAGITSHGERVISYWLRGGTAEQRAAEWLADVVNHGYAINSIWTISNRVAEHSEKLGDIQNAIRFYRIALAFVDPYKALTPHIGGNPDDMEFARTLIQNKIAAHDVSVELYAELRDGSGAISFHGAKHEPGTGLFFGEPPGAGAVIDSAQKPSSAVIYVEFEKENMETRVENDLL